MANETKGETALVHWPRLGHRFEDAGLKANRDLFEYPTRTRIVILLGRGPATKDELTTMLFTTSPEGAFMDWSSCRRTLTQIIEAGKKTGLFEEVGEKIRLLGQPIMVRKTNGLYLLATWPMILLDYLLLTKAGLFETILAVSATTLVLITVIYEFVFVLKINGRPTNGTGS